MYVNFSRRSIERFLTLHKVNIARKRVWYISLKYGRKRCFKIKFQYLHCVKRYHKYCKPLKKFRCGTNHYFWLTLITLFTTLTIQFKLFIKNIVLVLLITATYHLRIFGKTDYIETTQVRMSYRTIMLWRYVTIFYVSLFYSRF